ncbi:MAG: cyanophycinase [Polyangiaceae bacterium]|nr:cyanophycinase [Polyangiaceae bacterium]
MTSNPRVNPFLSAAFAVISALGTTILGGCDSSSTGTTTGGNGGSGGETGGNGGASTSGGGGSGGSTTGGTGGTGAGGADARPEKPAALVSYVTGNDADKDVTPTGPGLILMGGGTDVDAAFQWWKGYIAGGDVVVLRASGADGYNSYLYTDIGGCDSVETMLVTTPALAADPYVVWTLEHAEGIFMAGGDQAKYLTAWKDSPVEEALKKAWQRGAILGGTSAGCAVLGEYMFAAYNDTVYSDEALTDPYNMYMTMERNFLNVPPLAGWITDTHFAQRDRMGRLVGFLARIVQDGWSAAPIGLGVDEKTAVVVDAQGAGQVLGSGAAYVVTTTAPPTLCEAGKPLEFAGLTVSKIVAGETITFPSGEVQSMSTPLSASGGTLDPSNPY